MFFVIHCADTPGRLELRLATRPAHFATISTCRLRVVHGGPLLDIAKAELFDSVLIRPFPEVVRDGELLQ